MIYGTSRDLHSLQIINEISSTILRSIQEITLSTGKYSQKTSNIHQNVIKIEGLVYEVSLVLKGSTRQTRPLEDIEDNEGGKKGFGRSGGGKNNQNIEEDEI